MQMHEVSSLFKHFELWFVVDHKVSSHLDLGLWVRHRKIKLPVYSKTDKTEELEM